jgi:putative ABC transport system ATP-binding protein
MIRFRAVSKSYVEGEARRQVLDNADLEVPRGQFVALLGRSGSGKSTVLNLVAGLDRPDSGQVICGETEVSSLNERDRTLYRRRSVGFVFQFFNLLPTLTVEENMQLPLELLGMPPDPIRPLLEAVGLWDRKGSFPHRLSGGEQQRIAVARALVHSPGIVVADEPTGNLDADAGQVVLQLLRQLTSSHGTTLLVATHSQEVAAAADLVLRVAGGKVVR